MENTEKVTYIILFIYKVYYIFISLHLMFITFDVHNFRVNNLAQLR